MIAFPIETVELIKLRNDFVDKNLFYLFYRIRLEEEERAVGNRNAIKFQVKASVGDPSDTAISPFSNKPAEP